MRKSKVPLGGRIRIVRETRAISLSDLAQHIDITPEQLERIETGAEIPSFRIMLSIAIALEIHPELLYGLPDDGDDERARLVRHGGGILDVWNHIKKRTG